MAWNGAWTVATLSNSLPIYAATTRRQERVIQHADGVNKVILLTESKNNQYTQTHRQTDRQTDTSACSRAAVSAIRCCNYVSAVIRNMTSDPAILPTAACHVTGHVRGHSEVTLTACERKSQRSALTTE